MKKIAIIGASGIVGRNLIKILNQRRLTDFDFHLYAHSAHESIKIGKRRYEIKPLDAKECVKEGFDYAFLCTREATSSVLAPALVSVGTTVIDQSSYFRKDYPLIIPEINAFDIKGKLLTSPNCSTSAGVMALYRIREKFGLKRVIYTTFQAVSGAGKDGLDDYKITKSEKLKKLPFVIKNNLIPCIGSLDEKGNSTEENKMIFESRKILHCPHLKVSATCVRVPITIGHSLAINFETKRKASVFEIESLLAESEGVRFVGDNLPMPKDVRGQDYVIVGRVRKDDQGKNTFSMFVTSDNLRKGASQNAVQIFEELLKREDK